MPAKPKEEIKGLVSKKTNALQAPVQDLLVKLRQTVEKSINKNKFMMFFYWILFKVGHGEGENQRLLDELTSEDLKLHKADLKVAELEVFGHQLGENEWDYLTDEQKRDKSQKMLAVVKRRLEKRFKETGKF